jgi:hypothetical protein
MLRIAPPIVVDGAFVYAVEVGRFCKHTPTNKAGREGYKKATSNLKGYS